MMRLGLTGGIGMGKSTVAGMFAARGVPGFNADDEVHRLQARGGAAIAAIAAAFPGTVEAGVLDRARLRALVLPDGTRMRALEEIMHPLVRAAEAAFIADATAAGRQAVLLDIPLLLETGREAGFDKVIVVSCPREVQIERVRQRGLTLAQIQAIIARQMPDAQKREKADYVVETGGTLAATQAQVDEILQELGL
ncbi:dephospho-CoA kinase [Acidocella facilis]|uniref:dephospho-CoA kinase n=1 Tax=Acidocella facilis TaxID=525 RepID=UPI001EEA12E1|nr:dephospho-CoA kinase [Acidocella facilis]